MKQITGLTDEEQVLVERLLGVIGAKRSRNRLRSAYMDGKHVLRRLPPSSPPYLQSLAIVLGWPAKAVEALARRIRLDGFAFSGGQDVFGLAELMNANDYFAMASQAQLSALVHSTVFQTVTAGGEGEPAAVISQVSALNGTGDWDYRRREFLNFLAVAEWPETARDRRGSFDEQGEFTLFTDHQVIWVKDGQVQARTMSPVRMPVAQMPYKPRLDRPFGSSRISRPVMSITDSAVRTIIRSEGTADFYGVPWFMIFGPGEDAFSKGSWQMIMDRINAIPDNEDAANPRADVKQFSQGSQQPHVDQLQVLAGLFAGETSIPVSSLGVGLSQANPNSAESYLASREDLIAEAEDAQSAWTAPHRKVAQWAFMIANNMADMPVELGRVEPVWHDTRFTSRAAAADATVKLVSVFPWMANSDTVIETLGFDAATTGRLLADKRRGAGTVSLAELMEVNNGDSEPVGDLSAGAETDRS